MSATQNNKWQPNEEQRELLQAMDTESKKEKTVIEFAANFLPWGRSMFDQMMDALDDKVPVSYFDKIKPERRDTLLAEMRLVLADIPLKRLARAQMKEVDIHETSWITALKTAVREAGEKPGPERIVTVLGPTGGGKTIASNYLQAKFSAKRVEVRDIWRDSRTGFVPLKDIAKEVGLRFGTSNNMAEIQDELVKLCADRKMVLCFDEAEHFGRASLNLLKLLCNRTRIVPVLLIVPSEDDKWFNWFPNEAGQIARRTHAIIDASIVNPADVQLFFARDQFADPKEALALIATEASRFGHFSLVNRVASRLDGVTKATSGGEASDVRKALLGAKREMLRARKEGGV